MRRHPQLALLAVIGLLAGACSMLDPTFPEPGLVIFFGDTAQISAPDSAARGATFQVLVPTFAGGCTRTIARTETTITGMLAEIRPYNETRRADVCTDDLIILTHTASVHFDEPGLATIRVLAQQRPFQGTGARTGPAQLERQVIVP
jgi:hypothetical protein